MLINLKEQCIIRDYMDDESQLYTVADIPVILEERKRLRSKQIRSEMMGDWDEAVILSQEVAMLTNVLLNLDLLETPGEKTYIIAGYDGLKLMVKAPCRSAAYECWKAYCSRPPMMLLQTEDVSQLSKFNPCPKWRITDYDLFNASWKIVQHW